jgi:hypothetical protein
MSPLGSQLVKMELPKKLPDFLFASKIILAVIKKTAIAQEPVDLFSDGIQPVYSKKSCCI